jgi:hypothetical protein
MKELRVFLTGLTRLTGLEGRLNFRQEEHEGHEEGRKIFG